MWTYFVHMRKATVREVRNEFRKLEAWLAEGETILIERRGVPVARLEPPVEKKKSESPWAGVDFEARRRAVGGRVLTQADLDEIERFANEGQEG